MCFLIFSFLIFLFRHFFYLFLILLFILLFLFLFDGLIVLLTFFCLIRAIHPIPIDNRGLDLPCPANHHHASHIHITPCSGQMENGAPSAHEAAYNGWFSPAFPAPTCCQLACQLACQLPGESSLPCLGMEECRLCAPCPPADRLRRLRCSMCAGCGLDDLGE